MEVSDEIVFRPKRRWRDRFPVVSEQAMVIGVVAAIFVILVLIVVLTW
jgi:hypothetical protein